MPDLRAKWWGHKELSKWGIKINKLTVIIGPRHVVSRTGFVTSELVHSFGQGALRLAELNHARLEVIKRPFHEAGLFLVMS